MTKNGLKQFGRLKRPLSLLCSQVFKTQYYCKFARHILHKQTNDFWYFEDESRTLLKQPGQGNVVTQFLPNSPVKLWFSIKLIATEFFSTPFNCWMAI